MCFWAHYCKVLLLYNHPLTQERKHCGPTLFKAERNKKKAGDSLLTEPVLRTQIQKR